LDAAGTTQNRGITMSFTMDVKSELCNEFPTSRCCVRSHLAGIAGFCGAYVIEGGKEILRMRTESEQIANRIVELCAELFDIEPEIVKTGKIYSVDVVENLPRVLTELGFMQNGRVKFWADPFVVHDECCKASFVSGAFLGGGYVKTPKNGYHFEIKTHYRDLNRDLYEIMTDIGFEPKIVTRKSEYVCYIKQSDMICDILGLFGATDSMFELCNVKIFNDMKNKVTRRANCDIANINKSVAAAAEQLAAINKIKSKKGLGALPPVLEEMAHLRLENPDANLKELGDLVNPPISKSGVNHRLKKIIQFSEEL